MSLNVLLAEPDVDLARQQQAALEELDGLDLRVQCFAQTDVVEELERRRPDILVLRHERSGPTGFALIARLRKLPALKNLPVLLTTSDATRDAIDRHRGSPTKADFYLPLPASRVDLEEAVRMLSERARANRALMEASGGGPLEPPRLPRNAPAPTHGGWVQAGLSEVTLRTEAPPQHTPAPAEGVLPDVETAPPLAPEVESTTREALPRPAQGSVPRGGAPIMDPTDLAFVERLFSSMGNLSLEAPPDVPAQQDSAPRGENVDGKIGLLRDKLKERERDLQRLARLWRAKEQEIRSAEARVQQKESEVDNFQRQIRELQEDVQRAQEKLQAKDNEMGASVEGLLTERVMLEKDLIEVVASKEKEIHALKRERYATETATEALKQELVGRIYEWEAAFRELDARHQRTVAHGVGVTDDLQQRLDATRANLSTSRLAAARLQSRVAILVAQRTASRISDRELLAAMDQTHRALLVDNESLRSHLLNAVDQLRLERGEASGQLAEAQQLIHELDEERAAVERRLLVVEAWLTHKLRARDNEIERLNAALRHEKESAAQIAARLAMQELAAEQTVHVLDEELARARAEAGALAFWRARDRANDEDTITALKAQSQKLSDELMARELKLEELISAVDTHEVERGRLQESAEAALADRERRINELQTRLAEQQSKMLEGNEKRAGLERTLAARDATIRELNARLDETVERVGALEGVREQNEGAIRTLNVRLEERERAVAQRDTQTLALRAELQTERERVEGLTADLTARDEEVRVKGLEIKNLDAALKRKADEIAEMDQMRLNLQGSIARGQEQNDVLKARLKETTQQLAQRDNNINKLQADLARFADESQQWQRVADDRQAALQQMEATVQKFDEESLNAAARQRALETQVEAERAESGKLRATVAGRDEQVQELKNRIAQAAAERVEHEARLQALQADAARRDAQMAELRGVIDERKRAVSALESDLENRVRDSARLDARIASLQAELEAERAQLAQRLGERDAAQQQVAELQFELDQERVSTRERTAEVNRLNALLGATQDAQAKLAGREGQQARALSETQAERQRLLETIAARDQALKASEIRLREREEFSRQQGAELETLQRAIAEKTALAEDLQRLHNDAEQAHTGATASLDSLKEERDSLAEELFLAQQQARRDQDTISAGLERLKQTQVAEKLLRDELGAAAHEANRQAREAEERAKKILGELAAMRGERDAATIMANQLQEALRSLEEVHKDHERARSTLSTREAALNKQLGEAKQRLSQLEKATNELNREKTELADATAELQAELEAAHGGRAIEADLRQKAQEERSRAEAALKDMGAESEAWKHKFDERSHEVERLGARLEAEKESRLQVEESLSQHKARLEAVEQENSARAAHLADLERARTAATTKVTQLERKLQGLQGQMTSSTSLLEQQVGELQLRLNEQNTLFATEKSELQKRIQEGEAARARAEAAARKAADEKEALRRNATTKLQQLTDKLAEAETRATAAQQSASARTQAAQELENLRQAAQKARVERDALRKESSAKVTALQARIDRLTRALIEAGVTILPSMLSDTPSPQSVPRVADPPTATEEHAVTQLGRNPFLDDDVTAGSGGRPKSSS